MNIHKKINFKQLYHQISKIEILKSKYILNVTDEMKLCTHLHIDYDVISDNPKLFIHKTINGAYFTYRVSDSPANEFSVVKGQEYKLRAGMMGIKIIYSPK